MIDWGAALSVAEVVGKLGVAIYSWVADLIEAGKTPEEAEAIIRRDIVDRRAAIAAQRAAVDEAMKRKKYGEP